MASEIAGLVVTIVAVWGVLLNNRLRRSCFILWLMSNGLSALIHAGAGMWSLALRDAIFFGLCIEGLWKWKQKLIGTTNGHKWTQMCFLDSCKFVLIRG